MFKCDVCFNNEAKKLIACDVAKKVVCEKCHPEHSGGKLNLGVITKDLNGMSDVRKREIENRTITPSGKVINRVTGRPAQL